MSARKFLAIAAGFSALLLAAAAPLGPSPGQFSAAWQAFSPTLGLEIRKLKCAGLDDPTEFSCRFERRVGRKWQRWGTYVARDGSGWVLIDAPGPV